MRASSAESTWSGRPVARASSSTVRSSCVGPRPPGDDEQLSREPFAERRFDVVCPVPDDPDLGRLDPEREQRAREKRPVAVVAVAADELRAGDDDRRA